MAKKNKTVFVCQECGYESPKWLGQCICGAWNTMREEKIPEIDETDKRRRSSAINMKNAKPIPLSSISREVGEERIDTGIEELNRVLGGGLVKGSLVLISGEPGIGKSTLIMQVADFMSKHTGKVLYVTGEESDNQLRLRADRICKELSQNFYILAETNLECIASAVEELQPEFVIIDSIQTMYSEEIDSAPGSVSQVRACGNDLMRLGKMKNVPILIVAHVTKNGELAGPKTVEHMVDCVLNFTGERNRELRVLRAFKNRYGTTSEVGVFEMGRDGLGEVGDLSKKFLQDLADSVEGAVVSASYEGTRPLLIEVQSLVATTNMNFPSRTAIGIERTRLNMLVAVLERKAGINLSTKDIYVNVVGGMKISGTATDLAVALAIHSSCTGKVCPSDTIALGEIGLTGELRAVDNAEKIIKEAVRMGFTKVILPQSQCIKLSNVDAEICQVKDLREAIRKY